MEHVTADGWLYVALPSTLEIISWEDASDPEPGMPDHMYRYGRREDFDAAWNKVRNA